MEGYQVKRAIDVLREFIKDVEDSGGVTPAGRMYLPVGCPDWPDLGLTYMKACQALDRTPKVVSGEDA